MFMIKHSLSLPKWFTSNDLREQLWGLPKFTSGTNPRAFTFPANKILYTTVLNKAYF